MQDGWTRRQAAVMTGGTMITLVAGLVPSWRAAIVVALSFAAAVAPLVGMRVYRPAVHLPWVLISGMMGSWAIAQAVMAGPPHVGEALTFITSGQVFAFALFASVLAAARKKVVAAVRPSRAEALGHRVDEVVLTVVMALAVVQGFVAVVGRPAGADPFLAVVPSVDLVLSCLVLYFIVSRPQPNPSTVLMLTGGAATLVYDMLVTRGGHRATAPQGMLHLLWAGAACLFALGCLHPSMARASERSALRARRPESFRLLGLAPLAGAPVGLYVLGGSGRLPVVAYLLVGALVTALAILRGAQTLKLSEQRAQRDPLTGLANRRGLRLAFLASLDLAAAAPDQAPRLCLLDLEDFGQVNDRSGHEAGDDVLRQLAVRLRAAVGRHGSVARTDGDEFVLLLSPLAPDVAGVMEAVFTEPVVAGERPHRVRANAGVVVITASSDLDHALSDAGVALAAAKKGAGAQVVGYAPALREAVRGRSSLLADLRLVLDGDPDGGALLVYYQPLTDLASGDVVGCEALVRWSHPVRGLVPPDHFLPLAEEDGLGRAVDRWVFEESLAQLRRWDAAGVPTVPVSVNLGRSSMTDRELGAQVLDAMLQAGVACERIHLEITEHDELPSDAGVDLHELASRGVGVSLDDFGVGYTSLEYLRRFPIHVLKLDCSLTRPLQEESVSPLLTGIVSLARSLGVVVLAEGIETAVQQQNLTSLGVDQGQGYLIAKPLPAAEFAAFMLAATGRDTHAVGRGRAISASHGAAASR